MGRTGASITELLIQNELPLLECRRTQYTQAYSTFGTAHVLLFRDQLNLRHLTTSGVMTERSSDTRATVHFDTRSHVPFLLQYTSIQEKASNYNPPQLHQNRLGRHPMNHPVRLE
jgi:hypothetical protein